MAMLNNQRVDLALAALAVRQEQCQHDEQPHHRGRIWRMDRGMWRLNSHGISQS